MIKQFNQIMQKCDLQCDFIQVKIILGVCVGTEGCEGARIDGQRARKMG